MVVVYSQALVGNTSVDLLNGGLHCGDLLVGGDRLPPEHLVLLLRSVLHSWYSKGRSRMILLELGSLGLCLSSRPSVHNTVSPV